MGRRVEAREGQFVPALVDLVRLLLSPIGLQSVSEPEREFSGLLSVLESLGQLCLLGEVGLLLLLLSEQGAPPHVSVCTRCLCSWCPRRA